MQNLIDSVHYRVLVLHTSFLRRIAVPLLSNVNTVKAGQLTGSADMVASLTPFFSSSLYFKARRPISVVQTGCVNEHLLDSSKLAIHQHDLKDENLSIKPP